MDGGLGGFNSCSVAINYTDCPWLIAEPFIVINLLLLTLTWLGCFFYTRFQHLAELRYQQKDHY